MNQNSIKYILINNLLILLLFVFVFLSRRRILIFSTQLTLQFMILFLILNTYLDDS